MKNNKNKILVSVLGIIGLLSITLGVTIAFFNYTRTGSINSFRTGRISFNSSQSGTLNLTNVFPMTSDEVGDAELDEVSILITGDTTYAKGEEFLISLVDVTNTVNGKQLPLNYIATYTTNSGNSIGTEDNNYFISSIIHG